MSESEVEGTEVAPAEEGNADEQTEEGEGTEEVLAPEAPEPEDTVEPGANE